MTPPPTASATLDRPSAGVRPPVITSIPEARAAADALAGRIAAGSAERDLHRRHPLEQLHDLAGTGLLSIGIPEADGGGGLPRSVVGDVLRRIARGDSAVAQLVLSHFVLLDILGDA